MSGADAAQVARLSELGIAFPLLEGPVGAASALKMSYAGITKGFTAIAVAMVLGATRSGSAEALRRELALSQPQFLAWLGRQVPRMYSKAYRWVAEMEEIGAFLGQGTPGGDAFASIARLYDGIADMAEAPSDDDAIAQPTAFFVRSDDSRARRADREGDHGSRMAIEARLP